MFELVFQIKYEDKHPKIPKNSLRRKEQRSSGEECRREEIIQLGCNHVPEVQGCLQQTGTTSHLEDHQSLVDGVALVHAEDLAQFPELVFLLLLH